MTNQLAIIDPKAEINESNYQNIDWFWWAFDKANYPKSWNSEDKTVCYFDLGYNGNVMNAIINVTKKQIWLFGYQATNKVEQHYSSRYSVGEKAVSGGTNTDFVGTIKSITANTVTITFANENTRLKIRDFSRLNWSSRTIERAKRKNFEHMD